MTNEELKRYADPRRYNLILTLGAGRLQAWFEPYGTRTEAPVLAITSTWTPQPEQTLKQIENAVYDNSLLLEDYDCRMLLDTPQQLLFPPEAPRQLIEEAMKRFYDVAPGDIFTRPLGDAVIAFSLCTGLRAFLGRTFAGVEARHRLEPVAQWVSADRSAPGRIRVYADLDSPLLHLMAFNGTRLLHASSHQADTPEDAAYFIFALWQQLDLGTDRGELNVSGNADMRREVMPLMRRHLNYVSLSLLPGMENAEKVPTPVLLAFNS